MQIGYPDVVGLVPDYQGCVWFATAQGTSGTSGAVVGYYDPASNQTSAFTLPAGEQVANSISSSPTGVAVASTSALYLFQSGSSGPEQLWRQACDRGPARKPGQLSWGTGATPVFFGPTTGYDYLTITDNAAPQENILVYTATSGSLVGSVPFLISGTNSGNEDAAIAVGSSIYYPSTYGYQYPASAESGTSIPASAPFVGGHAAGRRAAGRQWPRNHVADPIHRLGRRAKAVARRQPDLHRNGGSCGSRRSCPNPRRSPRPSPPLPAAASPSGDGEEPDDHAARQLPAAVVADDARVDGRETGSSCSCVRRATQSVQGSCCDRCLFEQ